MNQQTTPAKLLAVHFPIHQRERLAQISAGCLARIRSELKPLGVEMAVVVIGNEPHAAAIAAEHGFDYFKYKNAPLGEKFNRGARYIVDRYPNAAYFMEWGQDNVTRADFAEMIADTLHNGGGVWSITTNAFYMIHAATGEVRKFERGAGSNIGRLTRFDLIKQLRNRGNGEIFDETARAGLDKSLRQKLQAVTGRNVRLRQISEPYLIDVKGAGNLNRWETYAAHGDRYPRAEIAGHFPELEQIRNLWQPPEKSEATRSTSTLAPRKGTRSQATPTQRTTSSKSSQVQQAAPSRASSKRSTRPAKTTTARGRS